MTCYSFQPKDIIFVKGYDFFLLLKIYEKNISKSITKNVSKKFSQKRIDHAKHFTINAVKATSKRAIQKTAVATGDLIGNKIVDKITQQFCESQKLHKRIIQKQMKKKFSEKDIHLQNKDRKLLMI